MPDLALLSEQQDIKNDSILYMVFRIAGKKMGDRMAIQKGIYNGRTGSMEKEARLPCFTCSLLLLLLHTQEYVPENGLVRDPHFSTAHSSTHSVQIKYQSNRRRWLGRSGRDGGWSGWGDERLTESRPRQIYNAPAVKSSPSPPRISRCIHTYIQNAEVPRCIIICPVRLIRDGKYR